MMPEAEPHSGSTVVILHVLEPLTLRSNTNVIVRLPVPVHQVVRRAEAIALCFTVQYRERYLGSRYVSEFSHFVFL